jgi:hypothetical protein
MGRPPEPAELSDWSKSKYKRFIDAVGGWDALQRVLAAAKAVADRHGVSVATSPRAGCWSRRRSPR